MPLGVAFQLRDDMLGAFGEPERTGKPVGDDLREGKPTVLLALARKAADESQRAVLATVRAHGGPEVSDDRIAAIQEVLIETGAVAATEAKSINCWPVLSKRSTTFPTSTAAMRPFVLWPIMWSTATPERPARPAARLAKGLSL